ncbi:MAG: GC-type dockerin domain-anchored protein [Phycisphaerales bacterium]|nr:GC-type dockerin domain-anchored protein [Phycisphaerales bacterium]
MWRDNQFYGYTARYDGETWWPLGSGLAQRSDPGALFGVRALASNGSSLFAAGSFGQVLPERVQNIGRWTGARWEGLGAGFASDYLFPPCLLADGEGVIVGGPFVAPLSVRNVARWEAGNWVQLGDGWPGVPVKRLARWAGSVVASGGAKIGVWNGDQWIEIAAQVNGEVNGLLEYGGELIAAGGFTEIDGEPLRGVARWDGTVWRPLGSGVDGVAYAACVLSGELYVSTPFNGQTPGGATMMRWDGDRWEAVPNTIGSYTGFLGTYEGRLIARGISNVLRFDGSTWVALDGPADGNVLAMCEHDGALVLGGSFATIGGLPANAVAMYRRNAEANRIVQQPWVAAHPHPYRGSMRAGLASVVRMTGAFSCSWIRNGVQVSWTSLGASGTPATDYTLAQTVTFSVADVNTYVLRIRDDCGTFESAPLVFDYTGSCGLADIGQAGGIDGADQLLDNNDFVVFIDRFFLGDVRADLSGPGGGAADGVLNNNDFIGFIDAFFAGCG